MVAERSTTFMRFCGESVGEAVRLYFQPFLFILSYLRTIVKLLCDLWLKSRSRFRPESTSQFKVLLEEHGATLTALSHEVQELRKQLQILERRVHEDGTILANVLRARPIERRQVRRTGEAERQRDETRQYILVVPDQNIMHDRDYSDRIISELTQVLEHHPDVHVLMDLTNIDNLSSSAMVTLITMHNMATRYERQLVLTHVHPDVMKIMLMTRIEKLMKIMPEPDETIVIHSQLEEAVAQLRREEKM